MIINLFTPPAQPPSVYCICFPLYRCSLCALFLFCFNNNFDPLLRSTWLFILLKLSIFSRLRCCCCCCAYFFLRATQTLLSPRLTPSTPLARTIFARLVGKKKLKNTKKNRLQIFFKTRLIASPPPPQPLLALWFFFIFIFYYSFCCCCFFVILVAPWRHCLPCFSTAFLTFPRIPRASLHWENDTDNASDMRVI